VKVEAVGIEEETLKGRLLEGC